MKDMTDKAGQASAIATRDLGNWTPETLAARIATGECAIAGDWCFTHQTEAGLGHYLDTRPKEDNGHNPVSGIAYND